MALTAEELQNINFFCVRTLKRYIEEAKRTCFILAEVRDFPIDLEMRQKILVQRQVENAAYHDYQVARQKLFEAAQWDQWKNRVWPRSPGSEVMKCQPE